MKKMLETLISLEALWSYVREISNIKKKMEHTSVPS